MSAGASTDLPGPSAGFATKLAGPHPFNRSPTFLAVVHQATAFDHVTSAASTAQLSLRLHDCYKRAEAAREAIRLEQERRKAEQRVEFQEMLAGVRAPAPETIYQIRKEGLPMKSGMPDKKRLDADDVKARRELKERKAREKAEERERLRRENAAMRARIRNTGAATDNDVSDDATGLARRKAAADAAAMKRATAERMAQANAQMKTRLLNTGAATDNDVSDDAVGVARREAAKASKARKAAEAQMLAEENAQVFGAIRSTGAATDNDVSDDAVGAMRRRAAADAKAAKAAEAAMLASENATMAEMLSSTKAWTDNDVADDATGAARLKAAGASKKKESPKSTKRSPKSEKVFLAHAPAPTELPSTGGGSPGSPTLAAMPTGKAIAAAERPPSFRPDLQIARDQNKASIERELQIETWIAEKAEQARTEKAAGATVDDEWDDTPRTVLW